MEESERAKFFHNINLSKLENYRYHVRGQTLWGHDATSRIYFDFRRGALTTRVGNLIFLVLLENLVAVSMLWRVCELYKDKNQ
jgi:hypothetical protein